jgi:glucose-1-phosphate thymidylyltransferase
MKALILAAGYATRLYPLTKEYPKPLLEVKERPIIDYIIEKLEAIDEIDEIIVITNSKFISRFRKWLDKLESKKRISLVNDLTKTHGDRIGAIGDMNFAVNKKRIQEDLLVIGGDNLFDGHLSDFISFAKANVPHPLIGVYDIKLKNKAHHYGVVKMDNKNKVVDFQEKPKNPKSTFVAMCLYYFPKEKLGFIKKYLDNQRSKNDATGFYIDWLRRKTSVYGFIFNGHWYDIGDHNFYNHAKKNYLKGRS